MIDNVTAALLLLFCGLFVGTLWWFALRSDRRRKEAHEAWSRSISLEPWELKFFENEELRKKHQHTKGSEQRSVRAPMHIQPWQKILGVDLNCTLDQCEVAYRVRAKKAHPDQGGSHAMMARLNHAITEARRFFRVSDSVSPRDGG